MSHWTPQQIIRKKRDGLELSPEELSEFFNGFINGEITDYQVSAMLMAIFLNGFNEQETAELTRLSRDSGSVLAWDYPTELVVDKHSTGGIGDKTSLILMPLVILEGLKVPMISGRGLGHTGGTLDKLEAIPGMNPKPDVDTARKMIDQVGGVFMGQTDEIARLDRRLYSLRDVTSTVESMPLIVASILSKKLAEGLGGLVLDVKFGSGAFMSDYSDAHSLAESLVGVSKRLGLRAKAMLTSMNSPLGDRAGNTLEILEVVEVLQGAGPQDTRDLSVELAAAMVEMAYPERSAAEIRAKLYGHLDSGAAFEAFAMIINAQGGDSSYLYEVGKFNRAKHTIAVTASTDGYVEAIDVRALGEAIVQLGGGRTKTDQKIDPDVGLSELKQVGQQVVNGQTLALIECNDLSLGQGLKTLVVNAYKLGPNQLAEQRIREVIQ
jgi:pyrimidine-nucleoside phosphorylase